MAETVFKARIEAINVRANQIVVELSDRRRRIAAARSHYAQLQARLEAAEGLTQEQVVAITSSGLQSIEQALR